MRLSKPFFQTTCHKCGCIDEAKFVFSTNGAVKQICNGFGFYVKFFDKGLVPTVIAIKEKIWYIVEADINVIENAKIEVEFLNDLKGLPRQIMYWKLYLHVRKLCSENTK